MAKKDEEPQKEAEVAPITEYDPRTDPGPERREDQEVEDPGTPLSADEVPLEKSRKDETTLLASDIVRVKEDGEIEIIK